MASFKDRLCDALGIVGSDTRANEDRLIGRICEKFGEGSMARRDRANVALAMQAAGCTLQEINKALGLATGGVVKALPAGLVSDVPGPNMVPTRDGRCIPVPLKGPGGREVKLNIAALDVPGIAELMRKPEAVAMIRKAFTKTLRGGRKMADAVRKASSAAAALALELERKAHPLGGYLVEPDVVEDIMEKLKAQQEGRRKALVNPYLGACTCASAKCVCEHIPEEHRRDPARPGPDAQYARPGRYTGHEVGSQHEPEPEKCSGCGQEYGYVKRATGGVAVCVDCVSRAREERMATQSVKTDARVATEAKKMRDHMVSRGYRWDAKRKTWRKTHEPHDVARRVRGWDERHGWPGLA